MLMAASGVCELCLVVKHEEFCPFPALCVPVDEGPTKATDVIVKVHPEHSLFFVLVVKGSDAFWCPFGASVTPWSSVFGVSPWVPYLYKLPALIAFTVLYNI